MGGVVKRRRIHYSADFETTTDFDDCRVWEWGMAPIDDDAQHSHKFEWGIDIASFIERVSKEHSYVYFHNLKFDGRFILDYIMKQGFVETKERSIPAGQFTTLISVMGDFYSIKVAWLNGKTTEFRDSYKKIVMPVSKIAEAFQLGETKGEIDYKLHRPIGHIPTAEELDYLRRDVIIVAQAMNEVIKSGMTKLTVGSDSLFEYKSIMGRSFERYFPVLSESMDSEIRRAYRGGFTYADERFHKRMIECSGVVLDVNSLYPSVMYDCLLPYGMPIFIEGYVSPTESHPLTIQMIEFTAKLKPNHIPCIQIKVSRFFSAVEYLKEINDPVCVMVTGEDWDLYNEHYDIKVLAYGGGWRFKGINGMFNEYIEKWSEIKANSKGGQREIAKMHLNTLYGKFATNPNVGRKHPVLEDNTIKLVRGPDEVRQPVYTAVGVFITSYARARTVRAAQDNYDVFAYADTDSLHLLTSELPKNLDIDPDRLGAWKHEYNFSKAFYIRPKAYMEHRTNDEIITRIAGLPISITSRMGFSDLYNGNVLVGKLTPKAVPGGIVLKDIPFELKI